MTIEAGTTLGRYEIQRLLGAGGMGEVYLARDTQLDRAVALKILPAATTAERERLSRFLQEARAASKIGGAHAAHIYEIGEAAGLHFIAMEYVEGEQLARLLAARRFPTAEVAHIGAQIAEALEEAHARGVTHRDIKPQNVVVTPRGAVKVLDFGLAKLTDEASGEAATRVKTNPGAVMGTVSYMSPEQALARADIDHRTDIFSLGVVLYEMLTGRLPFEGASLTETIDRIVHAQPEAVARFNYDAPAELEVIIKKALRKNRDERYQTARDIGNDLRALARELEFTEAREHSVAPDAHTTSSGEQPTAILARADSGQTRSAPPPRSPTAEVEAPRQTASSAEYVVAGIRQHKRGILIALAALVAVAAGIGFALYKYLGRKQQTTPAFQNFTVSRITTSGRALEANISPDGKYIVYLEMAEDGSRGLFVKQTATGNTIPIVPPTKGNVIKHTSFSPDGNFVYYTFTDRTKREALYQVSSVGGTPKKVVDVCESPAAVSPDGRRLAFTRAVDQSSKSALVVVNADGTGERVVATLGGEEWFSDAGSSWSPDGKTIATAAGVTVDGVDAWRLLGVDAETGATRELSPKRWVEAGRVVWMPDGSALFLIATERTDEWRAQVWRVSHPSGEVARVTNDVQGRDDTSLGVTADGRTLVTVTVQHLSRIETIPAGGDTSRLTRLTTAEANQEGFYGFAIAPDGRVVFSSLEGGQSDLWVMNADGSGRRRLTSDTFFDGQPSVSPDGRYVVFRSNRPHGDTVVRLWRMDIDGGNPMQLTRNEDIWPSLSPDGQWVVFQSWRTGSPTLWKVPAGGGQDVQISGVKLGTPLFSPDGKLLLCGYYDEAASPPRFRPALVSAETSQLIRVIELPHNVGQYRWSHDGRELIYDDLRKDVDNLWSQPVASGAPKQLTRFNSDFIDQIAVSPDGKRFALTRTTVSNEIVMIKGFR